MSEYPPEMLTLEQFAERLRVSRSTAYYWLAGGCLVPGRHVIRINRVVRILWSNDLVAHLLALSLEGSEEKRPRLQRNGKGGRNHIALDSDYLDAH